MAGMANNDRPFTQYDNTISPTQEDNGSNGADDRPVPDNGTKGANFSAGGMRSVSKVDYPLPPDPNSPSGKDYSEGRRRDQRLRPERVRRGRPRRQHLQLRLVGGYAKQDGADDSIAGQGFGSGSAGGGKTENTKD
jgi:hypothetical protein